MWISATTREAGQSASAGRFCGLKMADGRGPKFFRRPVRHCWECSLSVMTRAGSWDVAVQFCDRATGAAPGLNKKADPNRICTRFLWARRAGGPSEPPGSFSDTNNEGGQFEFLGSRLISTKQRKSLHSRLELQFCYHHSNNLWDWSID